MSTAAVLSQNSSTKCQHVANVHHPPRLVKFNNPVYHERRRGILCIGISCFVLRPPLPPEVNFAFHFNTSLALHTLKIWFTGYPELGSMPCFARHGATGRSSCYYLVGRSELSLSTAPQSRGSPYALTPHARLFREYVWPQPE